MRMTSTGAFPSALAAARPPKPPPTITMRGLFASCPSAPLIELRLELFIHSFLKLSSPEISENLDRGVRLEIAKSSISQTCFPFQRSAGIRLDKSNNRQICRLRVLSNRDS